MSTANLSIPVSPVKSIPENGGNRVSALTQEECEVLDVYRRAKGLGYADIAITIQDGKRVKLWLTEKKK
ncbi:MAG: hypothetical protein HY548_06870 [Elusimicrobia bacterium]|nr:hypothetical protein [Elusimicrobiota bacterium]